MATDLRRHLGSTGERLAREHFERLGYRTITSNFRTRYGEIDLIVYDGATLVFVEVKARREPARAGGPLHAVPPRKQRQVRAMAAAWLAQTTERPRSAELRFDVVGVTVDGQCRLLRLEHVEEAF